MKTFSIKAKKRTELGKKHTSSLRSQEQVPCVMYGGEEILHFYAHKNQFLNLVYTNQVYIVELDVDGTSYKAVLKDIQFHPVQEEILHIDFVQVFDDKPATVSIPIQMTGTSVGILAGGKLRQRRRYLKTRGLVANFPEILEVDITNLKIGSVVKVCDLSYPNLELLDPAQSMVLGIVSSRLAAKGDVAEEETSEGAETTEEAPAE